MDLGLITTKEVRTALARVRSARKLGSGCLIEMCVLRALLHKEGIGVSQEALEWALGALLYETARDRLCQLRGIPRSDDAPSPAEEQALLQEDFCSGNVKLESWSALFYRFLCPNTYLSAAELAAIALPHHRGRSGQRLFQRRVQLALDELTALLRDMERSSRMDARREDHAEESRGEHVDPQVLRLVLPARARASTRSTSTTGGESRVA
jgi:hypothetical protein